MIKRRARAPENQGELNIVPYLDILVNLIMFLLVTQATLMSLSLINVTAPSYVPPGPSPSPQPVPRMKLTVGIAESGFFIAGTGGVLPEIPRLGDGAFDYAALRRTMRTIKSAFPDLDALYLSADENIPYEVIVRTLDATREDELGRLFGSVAFTQVN